MMKNKENGLLYLISLNLFFLFLICSAIIYKEDFVWWEYLLMASLFLLAIYLEYISHSGEMHFKKESKKYKNHVLKHHDFFNETKRYYSGQKEYHYTLNCPFTILSNLVYNVFIPSGLLYLLSENISLLYFISGTTYFYLNEMLHFYYHLDEKHKFVIWTKFLLPMFYRMREHHQLHHHKDLMEHHNFGITTSLFDILFHTKYQQNSKNRKQTS